MRENENGNFKMRQKESALRNTDKMQEENERIQTTSDENIKTEQSEAKEKDADIILKKLGFL